MCICIPNSLLPIDNRVLAYVQQSADFSLPFDPVYQKMLSKIHGGTPKHSYFTTPQGAVRKIGWFVSFLDEQSELPPPFHGAFYYQENDARVDDRSIPALLNDEVDPFFGGERIFPFAALHRDNDTPLTLRLYTLDSVPNDSLCFDRSTMPQKIVLCNGQRATDEVMRWENGEIDEVDYGVYTEPIAPSFEDFLKMLRKNP